MTLRRTLHPQFYVSCAFRMLHIQELLSLLNTCIIAEREAMARQGTPQQPIAKPWLTRPDSGGSRGSQLLSSADLVSWIQSISRFINGVPGLCWGEQFYLLLCQLQNTLPSWLAASTYWSASFPPYGLNRSRPRGCWLRTTPQFSIPVTSPWLSGTDHGVWQGVCTVETGKGRKPEPFVSLRISFLSAHCLCVMIWTGPFVTGSSETRWPSGHSLERIFKPQMHLLNASAFHFSL